MNSTRTERRAHWQEWKRSYRRDWSASLYFSQWLEECHPIGFALLIGSALFAGLCILLAYAAFPLGVLWLLGAPDWTAIVLIPWLCFAIGIVAAMGGYD